MHMAKTIIRLPGQFEGTDEYQTFLTNTSDIFDDLNNQGLNDTLQNVDVDRVCDAATYTGMGKVALRKKYDIGSKTAHHQYLIKETSANVLNSRRLKEYNITIANPLNGDFRAGTGYTWYGGHKHDFLLKGLKYRATLANSIYSGNIEACNLFDDINIILTPTGNPDANEMYPNTMVLTVLIEGIKNPYGVTAFFLSDGFTFQHMKIYYGEHAGTDNYQTDLKADIARGSVSYMDWNADYNTCKSTTAYPMRIVFESNEVVRLYGMRVYGKTNQNITSGDTASRPVKTPDANTAKADLVVGQQYYDTTLERPVFYNGNKWTDPIGEVIGGERIGFFDNVTVPLPQQNVAVVCNLDGTFAFSGPGATGGGGRYVKLSNVFTLSPGYYILTREVISGSIEGLAIYLMNNNTSGSVDYFNVDVKTIHVTAETNCYIGINFTGNTTFSGTVKLSVRGYDNLQRVITSLLDRVAALENQSNSNNSE